MPADGNSYKRVQDSLQVLDTFHDQELLLYKYINLFDMSTSVCQNAKD